MTQELACGVGIPADVVGKIAVAGVAQLTVFVGQADQRTGLIGAAEPKTSLHSGNHLVAQRGGGRGGAQGTAVEARGEILRQLRTGVKDIVDQNAPDGNHIHILSDLVHKGNIARKIFVHIHQRGEILALQLDRTHDILECLLQTCGQSAALFCNGEILGHVFFAQLGADLGHLDGGSAGIFDSYCAVDGGALISFPKVVDGGGTLDGIQHAGSDIIVGSAQTQGEEQAFCAILGFDLRLHIGCGQLGNKADGGVGVAAVTQVDGAGGGEVAGSDGGRTIAHQHQDGLACHGAEDRIGDGGAVGVGGELAHSQVQTLLDVSAAFHHFVDGGGLLCCAFVNHIGIQGNGFCGRCLLIAAAAGGHGFHIVVQIIAVGGGIAPQGQHQNGIIGRSSAADAGGAGVQHHADTVVGVGFQQRPDGFVGSFHQFFGHIVVAIVVVHRAGNVQYQHGVGGHMGHAGYGHVGAHGGQGNQEAVLGGHGDPCAEKGGGVGENRFIGPYAACIFGAQHILQKLFLPAIHGGRVGSLDEGVSDLCTGGQRNVAGDHGQAQNQADDFFQCFHVVSPSVGSFL